MRKAISKSCYFGKAEDNRLRNESDDKLRKHASFERLWQSARTPDAEAVRNAAADNPILLPQRTVRVVEHAHVRLLDGARLFPAGGGQPAHDKSVPYYSERYVATAGNFNGQAYFNGGSKMADLIACRHLAVRLIAEARATAKLLPHRLFGSKELVAENVTRDTEAEFERMTQEASAKHIVSNDRFGHHLATFFRDMQSGEKKQFLICSGNHAMAFELHRKPGKSGGHDEHVVRFFDPNRTDVKIRCRLADPAGFESDQYTLRHFIGSDDYDLYFGAREKESILFDCTDADPVQSRFATLETASERGVSEILLHHLLSSGGDRAAFDAVRQKIAAIPDEAERRTLLEARSAGGVPALYMLLQNNLAASIKAYGEMLSTFAGEPEKRADFLPGLLKAKRANGLPGLHMALQNNCAAGIGAFTVLLEGLDLTGEERASLLPELLKARDARGIPGLFMALHNNRAAVIEAYGGLLERLALTPGERAEFLHALLDARSADGLPGLHIALQNNRAAAIEAYGGLLERLALTPGERAEFLHALLDARSADG
ncbi:ShET2/EspL2 family type III secretion system effector toxin, partial [Pseudochelatococcus lubricantis]